MEPNHFASETKMCSRDFSALLVLLQDRQPAKSQAYWTVKDCWGRFNLWLGSLGVNLRGKGSLDYRLRDAPRVRKAVSSFLSELQTSLQNATKLVELIPSGRVLSASASLVSTAETETNPLLQIGRSQEDAHTEVSSAFPDQTTREIHWGESEALQDLYSCIDDIAQIIDCLFRICVDLQANSGRRKLKEKAYEIDVSPFKAYDEEHVTAKFPQATPELLKKMVGSMTRRRQVLKYREEHAAKLAQDQLELDTSTGDSKTVFSDTTASTYKETAAKNQDAGRSHDIADQSDVASMFSDTTYATMADLGQLALPTMPEGAESGQFFQCPFCMHIQQLSPIGTRREWMKHIFTDLKPYLCTFDSCEDPDYMFDSRHAWFSHEIKYHRRRWTCVGHCELNFTTQAAFVKHALDARLVSSAQAQSFANMCSTSIGSGEKLSCPLCQHIITGAKPFEKHLGRHMEEIGLFALPLASFESVGDDVESDSGGEEEFDPFDGPKKVSTEFGVSLATLFQRDNMAVPQIVSQCIRAVDLFGLKVQHIYTIDGSAATTRALRASFERDVTRVDLRNPEHFDNNIANVTSLLKQFFLELPEPLFTTAAYESLLTTLKIEDDASHRDSIHAIINELPDPNYATLRALVLHLGRVLKHKVYNKMSIYDLSICFSEILIAPGATPLNQLGDSGAHVMVIDTILKRMHEIFDED